MECLLPKSSMWSMENKMLQEINKCYRPENFPNVVAAKVNSEIRNGNLLSSHRMTVINLRKYNC